MAAADPLIGAYDAAELEIAAEFLTNWLPFLTRDLCGSCSDALRRRIHSLVPAEEKGSASESERDGFGYHGIVATGWDDSPPEAADESSSTVSASPSPSPSPGARMSWADMALEDELEEEVALHEEEKMMAKKTELSRDQREKIRFTSVGRKKDFICLERINKRFVNVLEGLELHTGVFSAAEQKRIVDYVYKLQEMGRSGELGERTYSEPQKWMRGKGRVTIQFGCCYNYAVDFKGNPPGILRSIVADPIPQLFKVIIKRLVRWHVVPSSCIPDSCIVNIYEPGDCIPPHIDSHDFIRPFTTVSFLSECNIAFGTNLKVEGAGEFSGSVAIPLPVGSVLVFNGNAADVAKHCVPAVPTKRISITFRRMDQSKVPFSYNPEPDLQDIQLLPYDVTTRCPPGVTNNGQQPQSRNRLPGPRRKGSKEWKEVARNFGSIGLHESLPSASVLPMRDTSSIQSPTQLTDDGIGISGSLKNTSDRRRDHVGGRNADHSYSSHSHLARQSSQWSLQAEADEATSHQVGSSQSFGRRVQWVNQNSLTITGNLSQGDDSDSLPVGRRVQQVDQNSLTITRNLRQGGDSDLLPVGAPSMYSSRIHIRTLGTPRRRAKYGLSYDRT